MTGRVADLAPWLDRVVPLWTRTAFFLVATAVAGPYLGAPARVLFIAGCAILARDAWARSPAVHFQAVLAMFCFAPFLRRLVDAAVGFDPSGVMLAGPLVALLVTLPGLRSMLNSRSAPGGVVPAVLVFGGCVAYCAGLTLVNGETTQVASGTLKWGAPLVYALALYERGMKPVELVDAAASAFLVILPITGLYGIYQYLDPPEWDRYWLMLASITSAGLPEPNEVRTFSTMHAPAAFASYTATGLVLVYFLRPSWFAAVAMMPSAIAL